MKQKRTILSVIKKSVYLFAVSALSLASFGCGSPSSSGTSKTAILNVWMTFEESQNLQPLFSEFQKSHPGVQIVYTKKNVDNYESDLLNALATGNGPDIFSIHNDWLPKYLDKVTPAPDKTFGITEYKNSFIDASVNDFTKDSKIYGVPLYVDSLALYYNKDLLGTAGIPTPPKTWEELSIDVQKIKRQDKTGYFTRSGAALGTSSNVNRATDIVDLFMLQKGVVPFSADGQNVTFDQSIEKNGNQLDAAEEALNFYTSFASPASVNYNWNTKSDYSIDSFANGRAAFLYSYSYTRATILQKSPNLNFDVAPVPQPNLDDPSVNFANYWGQVVSRQSKNPNTSWELLKFLTSKASLDKYYSANKQPSSRKDLISLQIPDPDIGVFANANLTAKTFYKPDQVQMDTIFANMIDSVILKGLTTSDAISEASQRAQTLVHR